MIIRQMTIIEAYCDKCGEGQLKNLLDTGLMFKTHKLESITCACGHVNEIEDHIQVIPNEFFVASKSKVDYKKDDGVKRFIEDDKE